MVKEKARLIHTIRAYIKELSKSMDVESAYLFGSYAKGRHKKNSDIDLAIISKDASDRKKMFKILAQLSLAALKINPSIEAQIFSPDEFEAPEPESFVAEILKTGKKVHEKTTRK